MSMKVPCKGCEKRELGCHGKCADYLAFSAERQEIYKQRMIESAVEDIVHSNIVRCALKAKKEKQMTRGRSYE